MGNLSQQSVDKNNIKSTVVDLKDVIMNLANNCTITRNIKKTLNCLKLYQTRTNYIISSLKVIQCKIKDYNLKRKRTIMII